MARLVDGSDVYTVSVDINVDINTYGSAVRGYSVLGTVYYQVTRG